MCVYQKVRNYIMEHQLKQAFVAQKAGIPIEKFNAMLDGRQRMYADDLRNICNALNVSADIFIDTTALQNSDFSETKKYSVKNIK